MMLILFIAINIVGLVIFFGLVVIFSRDRKSIKNPLQDFWH